MERPSVGIPCVWVGSLQWFVGLFCLVLGALMLVAPHNVSAAGYAWVRPLVSLWAVVFFVAGSGLIVVAAVAAPWWIRVSAHFFAGALLLLVAAGFAARGVTAGLLNYTVLGFGTAAAALVGKAPVGPTAGRPLDLFACLSGINGILMGLLMLFSPDRLGPGLLTFLYPAAPWYGAVFLGAGLALTYAHVMPAVPVAARKLAHLITAATYVGVAVLELPQPGSATGVLFFGGFGIAVGLLPWIDRPMRRADPASLRVRLAVALAAAVAVPVILVVTLATAQEQRLVMDDQLAVQRARAADLANSIADYVRLNRAAVVALAAHPDLISMTRNEQTALLESFATAYTVKSFATAYADPVSFALYDLLGHPLARSDGLALTPGDGIPAFQAVRATLSAQMVVGRSSLTGQPELTISAPLVGADGPNGVVIGTLPIARLSDLLSRATVGARDRVFLVTDAGDFVASSGSADAAAQGRVASLPSVAALFKDRAPSGSLAYQTSAGGWLSGYARVPEVWVCSLPCNGVLGWAAVVEKPMDSALTTVDAERNLAFSLLLVAIALGVMFGVVDGGVLARPLASLAAAMGQYTETGSEAPLPRSTTSEVALLAASFAEMRRRVSARTEERQRAEEALRRESALVRLLQEATTLANEGGTSGDVFRSVLELICRSTGWAVGHVWLVSKKTDTIRLEPAQVWYVDEPQRRHVFRQTTASLRLGPGEGLPGQVLATGQPAWVAELSVPQDPRCQSLAAAGLKTGCAIPVEAAGQVVAVMEFFSADVRERDRMFLETITIAGPQIGHVLEREQRNRELEAFHALSRQLRRALTVEEMYPTIVEYAMKLLAAGHGALALINVEHDTFTRVYTVGLPTEESGSTFAAQCTRSGQVLETGTAFVTEDLSHDPLVGVTNAPRYDNVGPFALVPLQSEQGIIGTLSVARLWTQECPPFTDAEVALLQGIAEIGGTAIRRARLQRDLEYAYVEMVRVLARAVDARDSYTSNHSEQIAAWAVRLSRALGCTEAEGQEVHWAGLLHDIGKLGVPEAILRKPGPLNDGEWQIVRRHPIIGAEILRPVERLAHVAPLVRHHHEWWNGAGYPDGLRGDAIPLGARILAVVDAYSAILDDRAYARARTSEEALEELRQCAGTQFDPEIVEILCQLALADDLNLPVPAEAAVLPMGAEMPSPAALFAQSLAYSQRAGRAVPAMTELAKQLLRPLDLTTLLDEVLRQIQEVFGYPMCAVLFIDERAQELYVVAQRGFDPAVVRVRMAIGKRGVTGWVARHRRTYYAPDIAQDPQYVEISPLTRSNAAFPLIVDDRIIGVLNVESPSVNAFSRETRNLLEAFAVIAGLAILRAQRDDEFHRLALTDGLTGLANRRALWEALQREIARAHRQNSPLSIVMIEVDRFKLCNDILGHLEGDRVLKAIADVLRTNTRAMDLVARFGGDEFILLLPDATISLACEVAERVRDEVERLVLPKATCVTSSFGVASMPQDGTGAEALIETADQRMYEAKRLGGNRVAAA